MAKIMTEFDILSKNVMGRGPMLSILWELGTRVLMI